MTAHSTARKGTFVVLVTGLFAVASLLFAGAAFAQNTGPGVNCPAGARGGAGGAGGTTTGGEGGTALNVPVFGTGSGGATAGGATGGSARGGEGGRGGSGTLPVCNQNTNGAVRGAAPAPLVVRTAGGGRASGGGGGLAHTGSRTYFELGLAGVAFVIGGAFLFFGQPMRRASKNS